MPNQSNGMSNKAVMSSTGKDWNEWFELLDEDGAVEMKHADIARMVQEQHDVSGWWAQMVTVEYERERGLREVHQTARGFEVSVSKTVAAGVAEVYSAWEDEALRGRWLGVPIKVRKSNVDKSMRIEMGEVGSNVAVHFYAKGQDRSQVVVQQTKLADKGEVESQRAFWKEALSTLGDSVVST